MKGLKIYCLVYEWLGDIIVEIGANWIHGPCEENPVFRLARQYGLLDPQALTEENQAIDIGGHPPWVPMVFSSSGQWMFCYYYIAIYIIYMAFKPQFHYK